MSSQAHFPIAFPHPPARAGPIEPLHWLNGSCPKVTVPHVPSAIAPFFALHVMQLVIVGSHGLLQQTFSVSSHTVLFPQLAPASVSLHGFPRHAPQSGPPQSMPVSFPSFTPSLQLTHVCVFMSQTGLVEWYIMQSTSVRHPRQVTIPSHTPPFEQGVCAGLFVLEHTVLTHLSVVHSMPSSQSVSMAQWRTKVSAWKGQPMMLPRRRTVVAARARA